MNPDEPTKEGIVQQLNHLSKRYGELVKLFDEMDSTKQQQTAEKPSWTALLKNDVKKRINKTPK